MKKFEAEKAGIIVRELTTVTVIFYDKYRIFVYPKDGHGYGTVFHRYGAPRGYYEKNWNPFRRKLLRYKRLTLRRCYELALEHEILAISTSRTLDLSKENVIIRD